MNITSFLNNDGTMTQNEKLISVGTGGLMLARALMGKKSILQIIPAGYMIYRGITGRCPVSEFINKQIGERDLVNHSIEVKTDITVNKPRKEVYAFWRKLENLPIFMKHIDSIEVIDKIHSQWTMKIFEKFGSIQWKAEITSDQKNELISWQSLPDSQIENFGQVMFKDAGESGTEVNVIIRYTAPAGAPGEGIARLLNPLLKGIIREDLKNFKSYIETGEIPTIKGQSNGRDNEDQ